MTLENFCDFVKDVIAERREEKPAVEIIKQFEL
jgi:hypothetical protein